MLLCTRTGIERRKGGLRLSKACIQSAPSSLPSTTLCFCYATTRSIGTSPTYVQVRYIKMNSLADTRCKKRPCVMSAVFVFFARLYLRLTFCLKRKKKRLRGNREEQDTEERGEGREGVSMKALLLRGLSWCNTSTSCRHGNPASAPTGCGEEEPVSVLVCYSTVPWEKKSVSVQKT